MDVEHCMVHTLCT